jgi:hypothetical protein
MADHAVLVGICNGAGFKHCHGPKGPLYLGLHTREIVISEVHPADIKRHPDGRTITDIVLIPFPERTVVHGDLPLLKMMGAILSQITAIVVPLLRRKEHFGTPT